MAFKLILNINRVIFFLLNIYSDSLNYLTINLKSSLLLFDLLLNNFTSTWLENIMNNSID